MKRKTIRTTTQLAVIGTGIAGCAASLFARDRGIDVAQFGHSGMLAYTTGYLDLLGVLDGAVQDKPWAALGVLRQSEPDHPLSRLSDSDIRTAFGAFAGALTAMGVGYTLPGERNLMALLPTGLTKPTLSVPATMLPGIEARARGATALIVGFDGLQGFSAEEFRVNMGSGWPGLRAARLIFPGLPAGQTFPEVMARVLETGEGRDRLAGAIRPVLNGAEYVGLPAILGMHAPDATRAEMERLIGARLFEIPTIPPAVPGIRLREMFERELPRRGVRLEPQLKVRKVAFGGSGITLYLSGQMDDLEVEASAVVLATGRFLSGGLSSDRHEIREPLLDLPLIRPDSRDDWFGQEFLDPRGHAINRIGVTTDEHFHPLGRGGTPVDPRLFAAGIVLARQDWVRQRAGAGVAIASAYGAVRSAAEVIGQAG